MSGASNRLRAAVLMRRLPQPLLHRRGLHTSGRSGDDGLGGLVGLAILLLLLAMPPLLAFAVLEEFIQKVSPLCGGPFFSGQVAGFFVQALGVEWAKTLHKWIETSFRHKDYSAHVFSFVRRRRLGDTRLRLVADSPDVSCPCDGGAGVHVGPARPHGLGHVCVLAFFTMNFNPNPCRPSSTAPRLTALALGLACGISGGSVGAAALFSSARAATASGAPRSTMIAAPYQSSG